MSPLPELLDTIASTNLSDIVNSVRVATVGLQGPPGIAAGAVDFIRWDTTPETSSDAQGSMAWDADEKTLGLIQNGTTLQLGQEQQWNVRNTSGATILNGAVVMATGAIGASGRITAGLMDGTDPDNASLLLGLATEDIANNADGKVSTFGKVRTIDTSGQGAETWVDGNKLWVSPTTAGGLTNVEPVQPDLKMPVAFVVFANPTNGTLAVRVTPINENVWDTIFSSSMTDYAVPAGGAETINFTPNVIYNFNLTAADTNTHITPDGMTKGQVFGVHISTGNIGKTISFLTSDFRIGPASKTLYLTSGATAIFMVGVSTSRVFLLAHSPGTDVANGAYVVKGAYEQRFLNESTPGGGVVEGSYVFDYDSGNSQELTFTAADCDLSWTNLPPDGNDGYQKIRTHTGPALPSTLGGELTPDWQVELLSMLIINSTQTFEWWVEDGATGRINVFKYSGQA